MSYEHKANQILSRIADVLMQCTKIEEHQKQFFDVVKELNIKLSKKQSFLLWATFLMNLALWLAILAEKLW